ncbi:MAG: phosphate transport system substrate-binding protein [Acidobacteriota bacterium]|nr:phosphate transport system substrate-binding protein [Acidobacteriota bacterium]
MKRIVLFALILGALPLFMNARLAEAYMAKNTGTSIQVTGGGSGGGIAAASRPIKATEVDKLKSRFATTGYANSIKELTLAQLRDIYTGRVTNWREVGGKDAPIIRYSRESSSGTYTYFKDNVLMGKDYSPRAQTLQGTAAVVNAVANDPNGIGYGGAAYAKRIKFAAVKENPESPAYEPTLATIRSGQYPITRFLYLYTRTPPTATLKHFNDWTTTPEAQALITEVGYFPVK